MSPFLYRIITTVALTAAVTGSVFAQAGIEAEHGHGQPDHICGTITFNDGGEREAVERTRANNPALYRKMVEYSKGTVDRRGLMAAAGSDDIIFPFFIRNRVSGEYEEIQARLAFKGKWSRIWVDVRDTAKPRVKNIIPKLRRAMDTATATGSRNPNKGIVENDQEVFGMPPVNRFDPDLPTQDFLLTDIQDALSGGFVGGFFQPYDQTDQPGSNRMNILYIDSNEGLTGSGADIKLFSTMAHEFQHLIHYRTNKESHVFFNEGCSETASLIMGYKDRSNSDYLGKVNMPLFRWSYDDNVGVELGIDYQRAMTFVHYMYEQYGESFLTAFASTKSDGMERIAQALTTIGREPDWKMLLNGYAVANYVGREYPDSRFIFRNRLSNKTPVAEATYDGNGELPGSASAALHQYATAYVVYNNPGGLKFNFKPSSQPYKAMAMLYNGGSVPVQVTEVNLDQDYTFARNGSAPYTKIVLAVVNHSSNAQTANWTVERVTLGVDDVVSGTTGGLAISEIVPNPSRGASEVRFTNARAGAVTVDIYSTAGELVKRVVDGERYETGEHGVRVETSDMQSGVYMVRVSQESGMTNGVLVVLNK